MNKKSFFLVISLLGMAISMNAQFSFGKLASDALIEKALNGGIVIVEQKYQLKDKSGDLYGRGGNDEFGSVYSIGVMTKGGLVINDYIAHPWDHDGDYDQYRENKNYTPVLFKTSIKAVGQSEFKTIETNIEELKEVDDPFFFLPQSNGKLGLTIADTTGTVDGWMVWATIPVEEEIGAATELKQVLVSKKQFDLKNKEFKVDTPESLDKIVLGFFTIPRITETGSISFEISGILYKKDSEWTYLPVKLSWQPEVTENSTTVDSNGGKKQDKDEGNNKLTPSSGNNGKQKKGKR